jgi:hypothetical protein
VGSFLREETREHFKHAPFMSEHTRHYPNSALYSTDFSTPVHIEILDYGERETPFVLYVLPC